MRTCIHCGCEVRLEGTDAYDRDRWVTEHPLHGTNRHCAGPTDYHEPAPLIPDLTDPEAVAAWLV